MQRIGMNRPRTKDTPHQTPHLTTTGRPHEAPIGILFVHPQYLIYSDTSLYCDLMRHADPRRFKFFVACTAAPADDERAAINAFRQIPGLTVLPTAYPPGIRGHGSKLRRVPALLKSAPAALADLLGLVWLIRKHNIRILHSSDSPRESTYNLALARLTGAATIFHIHAIFNRWFNKITRFNLHRADALVAVSQAARHALVETGYNPERIHTVLNGIKLARWVPGADRAAARAELGIPPDVPVVTTVARVYPDKGHADVVRALAAISPEVGDFRYLVVGADDLVATEGGVSWTAHLKALAAELGIADKLVFSGYRGDVERMLAASDVYALASKSEAMPLGCLEAGAMGLPVVGNDTTGIAEAVEHDVTGLLSPCGDGEALARNLQAMLSDPARRRQLGAAARARVERQYTTEHMTAAIEQLYELLAAGRPYGRLMAN